VLTILNGIRLERFWTANPEQKRAWRESHGVAPISTTFVCVARLSREKNIGEILQVLARREVAYHQAVLVIVGDGPPKKDLERQARELGCAHRCLFLGRREDVNDILAVADAAIMFSQWEGGPLSVVEAMASSLPVIASDVGAVREMVVDGGSGLILRAHDLDGLATAVTRMCREVEERARMGCEGRRRASEAFSSAAMARKYVEVYENLVPAHMI